jgi:hypothetical protein
MPILAPNIGLKSGAFKAKGSAGLRDFLESALFRAADFS